LRTGYLSETARRRLGEASEQFRPATVYVDDTPRITHMDILSRARACKHRLGIDLVVVDYLQLMHAPGHENRVQAVGEISRNLKLMARELELPVIVMCQLNRQAESREDHRPRLGDLRESGNIEQEADIVGLLYRSDYYEKDPSKHTHLATLEVAKQRNGPTGSIDLAWDAKTTKFYTKSLLGGPA